MSTTRTKTIAPSRTVAHVERLAADWAHVLNCIEDSDGELSAELEDALTRLDIQTDEDVEMVVRAIHELDSRRDANRSLAAHYTAKARRFDAASENVREALRTLMLNSQRDRLRTRIGDVVLTAPRDVVEVDGDVPDEYVRVTRSPIKSALLAVLKAGEQVPGARLVLSKPGLRIP